MRVRRAVAPCELTFLRIFVQNERSGISARIFNDDQLEILPMHSNDRSERLLIRRDDPARVWL